MKRIVSISLGSSKRDHAVELNVLGEKLLIERIGTDGSLAKAEKMVADLDGKVDVFGLGGTDLYLSAGNRKYLIRDAAKIARHAQKTPIVDGGGLKDTLERNTIDYLQKEEGIDFSDKKVMLVSAMDRFGMAEAFEKTGAKMIYGDLIFALGIPIPLHSLKALDRVARVLAPIVVKLPFTMIYPTGSKQDSKGNQRKFQKYYTEAEVIAGDFHFIKKHMPARMEGKIIVTNTVTKEDISDLKDRGVELLVTTTPHINGRSFGTNVMEAALVALSETKGSSLTANEYQDMLKELNFHPHVIYLQSKEQG